ncbi:MAG: cellulose binding domain-containing protein [Pseudomonadota bacterium]
MNISLKKFLKRTLTIAGLCSLALPSAAIWTVKDGKLLDPNGQPFIFRGITIDHLGAPDKAVQAIKDAAAAGANAVQVEIAGNYLKWFEMITAEELRIIVEACKANGVMCVLEPNDVAGWGEAGVSPETTVRFWQTRYEALRGYEDYVVISLGNQALGTTPLNEYHIRMYTYLHDLNYYLPNFLIMIDGNHWGQDRDNAMQTFAADNVQRGLNVIYSVEMFDAFTNPEKVRDYIAKFSQIGAPLVIGGFAPVPYYHPHYRNQPLPIVPIQLPAASVMQYAQEYGAGYFAWSWSGNLNPELNLTNNWDANLLTAWGELAINGTNGIKATAKRATHFSSTSSSVASSVSSTSSTPRSSSSSSAPNNPPAVVLTTSIESVSCGLVNGKASAVGSSDPDGDTLTYDWQVAQGSNVIYKSSDIRINFAMRPVTNYTVKLTVSDGKGGTAAASKILSHSHSDNCISSGSSSSIVRPSSSSIAPSSSSMPSSVASSSVRPSSVASSTRNASSVSAKASCSYVIGSQWGNGFTAAIRVKNTSTQTLNGWSVNWQYSDGSKVTNSWNATLNGSNPYNAKNLGWNANIQPGQTVEFGFQGSKPAGAAVVPVVSGVICQ